MLWFLFLIKFIFPRIPALLACFLSADATNPGGPYINFACRFGYLMTETALTQAFSSFGGCQFGNAKNGGLGTIPSATWACGIDKKLPNCRGVMLVGRKPMVCTHGAVAAASGTTSATNTTADKDAWSARSQKCT